VTNKFPPGWDEARVKRVIDYNKAQSEEHGAVFTGLAHTLMEIPADLVPTIRELIAKHNQDEDPEAR
jgi:hypothetical protein